MKRSAVLAALALLVVLCAAVFRPRLVPHPEPLPHISRGVELIAVEGMEPYSPSSLSSAPHLAHVVDTGAIGLVPTRNGTPHEDDFNAGLKVLFAGTRSPNPGAPTLPDIARQANHPYHLHTFTGKNAVRDLDTYLGTVADTKNPTLDTLVIVGITPSQRALAKRERVAPLIIWQRGIPPRLLTSPSTRNRPGLCALTDVAATVAALLEVSPYNQRIGDGRPAETLPRIGNNLWEQAMAWGTQAREQKLLPAIPWILAGLVLGSTFVRGERIRNALRTAACAIPLSLICSLLFLLPFHLYGWEIYVGAFVVVATLAAIAYQNESIGARFPRYLAIATAVVIAGDTLLGGPLLSRTPLSYSVLEAARFYGIGNEVSGLFLGSALVAVGSEAGILATVLWGLAVAVVSGAPTLGADAGGFIADLVAVAGLAILQRPATRAAKYTLLALIAATVVIIAAIVTFALLDSGRSPESRTHVGQFVITLRERGIGAAETIILRKLEVNARLLVTSPWAVLFATEAVFYGMHQRKQKREEAILSPLPALNQTRFVQTALIVATITLFALNDSGVVAGATCGLWLLALRSDNQP